jgi:voltage-gated potassium channel Kch
VVVTLPDYRAAEQVIQGVRARAPSVPLIARARYHLFAGELSRAGATAVIDEEHEVGQRLADAVSGLASGDAAVEVPGTTAAGGLEEGGEGGR